MIELTQKDSLKVSEYMDNTKMKVNEVLELTGEKKEYTVVGIIERLNYEKRSSPGYIAITKKDEASTDSKNIFVLLKKPKNYLNLIKELSESNVLPKFEEKHLESSYFPSGTDVELNNSVLRYEGVVGDDSIQSTLYSLAGIVIFIIIVSSITVIRNSFSISVTERTKQYGILSSIGATSKQIKKNVLYEGIIISIISIPIGLILGNVAILILLDVINYIGADYLSGSTLGFYIWWPGILIATLISLFTMYISILKPAKRTSKISPIDSIRMTQDIKTNGKKLKTSKLFNKIFGIEGIIASKNLKRSKKKYRTTILSIVISIVIFITLNSFVSNTKKVASTSYEDIGYNIRVQINQNKTENKSPSQKYKEISKMSNIKNYSLVRTESFAVNENDISNYGKELVKNYFEVEIDKYNVKVYLISLGKPEYETYIKKIGGKVSDYEDKAILVDKNIYRFDGKKTGFNFLKEEINDNIKLLRVLPVEKDKTLKEEYVDIKIAKRSDVLPLGLQISNMTGTAYLIVSDEYMDKYNKDEYNGIYINSSDAMKLEKQIKEEIPSIKNNVYNLDKEVREQRAMIAIMSIFLYGFITVITLIGITNIFNTITTNIALRKKEFAVLRSIGMTDKEFTKMINFESLLYGLKSLIYGIPIGVFFSYIIYLLYGEMFRDVAIYRLPFESIGISIVFVFIIIFSTMNYSSRKIKKQNIIETIRNENI